MLVGNGEHCAFGGNHSATWQSAYDHAAIGRQQRTAGSVTKTFPDLEGQVRLFLDLPMGMTYKEFRLKVPAAWHPIAVPRVELVEGFNGPSNNGSFVYRLAAKGIQQPQLLLRFWKNRLVYAYLDYKHRFTLDLDDEVHEASVRRTEELLRRLFGEPKKGDANVNRTSLAWENKAIAVDFEVSDDGTHPLGDVTLSVSDRENFVGSSEWQRDADSARGSGPGVTVDCSHT